jgi:hypothetical protein
MNFNTLIDLDKSTPLEVFDFIASRLLAQGEKSLAPDGACAYATEDGLQCAAGLLFSPEAAAVIETTLGFMYNNSEWCRVVDYGFASDAHVGLISDLQKIHDNEKPSRWPAALAALRETVVAGDYS